MEDVRKVSRIDETDIAADADLSNFVTVFGMQNKPVSAGEIPPDMVVNAALLAVAYGLMGQ